jgi:hypothetical protein
MNLTKTQLLVYFGYMFAIGQQQCHAQKKK